MALINLRNALMAGKRLPYDAEVEYLESTGTQYINTGVYADLNTVVELFGCSTDDTAASWMFGARDSYRTNAFAIYNGSDVQYRYTVSYDSIGTNRIVSNVSSRTGDMVFMRLGANTVIDSWTATYSEATQFTTSSPILIFACWQNGVMYGKCKISSFKIYQNGTLIHDYIPVRKGTTGELYDRLSGKFAERHGDFQYGQDVVPVKYLESSGTQWIDTEYTFDSSTDELGMSFELLTTTPMYKWIFGAYDTSKRVALGSGDGVNRRTCSYNETTLYLSDSQYIDSLHTYNANSGGVYLDGERRMTYASFQTTSKITLFTIPYGNDYALFCSNARISAYEHIRSGVNLVKLRSVRVGTEGAMMNVLTRRIYRNAGTGAFTYGNDLKYPIPAA